MVRSFVAATALLALATAAYSATGGVQYGFQDSRLGEVLEEWKPDHPSSDCDQGDVAGEVSCRMNKPDFVLGFGGVYYRFFAEGAAPKRLYQIEIIAAAANESDLRDGLIGKWGKPTDHGPLTDVWRRSGSTIRLMRTGSGVQVTIEDDKEAAAVAAKRRAAAAGHF